jgi:hypothetical protein
VGRTDDYLTSVRSAIAADDIVLAEARARLALVRNIAIDFPGALRTYASGSLPQHTVNHPVTDGDGGLVLNRVNYPELGPEGGGETPNGVASDLCGLLGPEIRKTYPKARCGSSKPGPKITVGDPGRTTSGLSRRHGRRRIVRVDDLVELDAVAVDDAVLQRGWSAR